MGKHLFFSKLVTKNLTAIDSNRRLFEGILTVEMKDRQGEITVRDELLKVLPIWIARGGPITDTHSNRVVGQGINFGSTTVTDSDGIVYPAISIQGEIFKDYELDNEIWKAITTGKYKGLSFGGATKSNRVPIIQKDGSVAYSLKDLEQYEVAVCEEPAVPLALITQHNEVAKAMAGRSIDRGDGTMCIRCDKFKCYVDKSNVTKYEPFSDTQGANAPEGRDTQADSFEKKQKEDEKKDDKKLTSAELEEERGQGPNQDNGATYHGTSKDGKAMDVDDKEMLEDACLTEEKKLEYADGEPDGPIRKYNTNDPGSPMYDQTNEEGEKVNMYGKKIPKIQSKKPNQVDSAQDTKGSRYGTSQVGFKEQMTPTKMTTEQLRARQTKLDKPKAGGKNVKWSPTVTHDKKTGMTTIDSTGKPRKTTGSMGKITIPTERYISNFTKSLDILKLLFNIKSYIISDDPNSEKPNDKKTTNVDSIMEEAKISGEGKKFLKNPNKEFKYASHKDREGNIEDIGDKGASSIKHPEKNAFGDEQLAAHATGDKKVGHTKVSELGNSNEFSASYARKLTSLNLDLLRDEFLLKTQDLDKATCYNTDEVVREYDDDEKKKAYLYRKKLEKYSFDEAQKILNKLLKSADKYPGLTPEKRKIHLEIDAEKYEDPYDKEPEVCKTNTDARTYTEPARGGFAGREPGETCDYNESTSIHDVTQPKHVNRPTDAEGADGLKKVAGDPQLSANNAEDGIKDKFRLDVDPPAESFENKASGDFCTHCGIGKKEVSRRQMTSFGDSCPNCGHTKDILDKTYTSPEDGKPNIAGWDKGESTQKPDVHPSTDEHHAMVLGKVPPSSVVGSQEHNNSESHSNESEMNSERYNHGMNQSQDEAASNKSTNINDPGHGSGGIRTGAAYDNAQQDTAAKDNPRVVIEENYTGGEDTGNNSRNKEDEDKAAAKEEPTPSGLEKT
jgi:hypothetical protein